MAGSLEHLDRQRDTLQGIRGIVRTMKTLSAINALPYERAARAIETYRDTVSIGLQGFLHHHGRPATSRRGNPLPVIVALGSDHGLCGNYNEIVAAEVVRDPDVGRARLLCVGAQMADALTGQDLMPEAVLLPPASVDGLGRLAGELVTRLDTLQRGGGIDALAVTLVFTQRGGHARQHPVTERLLPLDPALVDRLCARPWGSRSLPQTTLPPDGLFAALVREFLFATVFAAAAEALVTENAARLARMQEAVRSVDERLEDVSMQSRSVRQAQITTELLDVITGFEAMRGERCVARVSARRPRRTRLDRQQGANRRPGP